MQTHLADEAATNDLSNEQVEGGRRVLFLVPKVCLARQQFLKFRKYLSEHESYQLTGRQGVVSKVRPTLKLLLAAYKIIVMTPQVGLSLRTMQ